MIRTLLVLGRVSNLPTVWTNCIAGWFLAGGAWDWRLAWVGAGASLMYTGGMFLNDACDVEFDREHCPDRPIPAGRISRWAVIVLSILLLFSGCAVFLRMDSCGGGLAVLLLAAIIAYDLVHKRWSASVLLMGASRLLLVAVAGAVAAGGVVEREVWIAGSGLFGYIVGVSVTARGESTGGRAAPWCHAFLAAPVGAWLILGPNWTGAIFAGLFGAWFALQIWRLRRAGSPGVGSFVGAMLAGIVLSDALLVSAASTGAWAALVCAVFLPLNILLQRSVPAT